MFYNSPHCLRIIGGDMAVTSLRFGTVATCRNRISAAIAKGCGQCCFTDLPLVPGRCSSWGTMLALQMVTIWVVSTIIKHQGLFLTLMEYLKFKHMAIWRENGWKKVGPSYIPFFDFFESSHWLLQQGSTRNHWATATGIDDFITLEGATDFITTATKVTWLTFYIRCN